VGRSPPPSARGPGVSEASDTAVEERQGRTRTKLNSKESTEPRPSACMDGEHEGERNEYSESTDNEIIRDIYKEKESLESFLFNESNKINRTAIKLIMSKWAVLESKLIESILENEKAKAKISELKMENMKL